jgi:hypothetical protein
MDNARYQRCATVSARAAELDLELLFLPAYSPNLNLIERHWKLVKKRCLTNRYYESFADFRHASTPAFTTSPQPPPPIYTPCSPSTFSSSQNESL